MLGETVKYEVLMLMIRNENKPCPDYVQRRRGQYSKQLKRQALLCSYNLTLRRVRATIVAVEEKSIVHILSLCL
jgi:hypothetical protein